MKNTVRVLTGAKCRLAVKGETIPHAKELNLHVGAATVATVEFSAYDMVTDSEGKKRIKMEAETHPGPGIRQKPVIRKYKGYVTKIEQDENGRTVFHLSHAEEIQNGPNDIKLP